MDCTVETNVLGRGFTSSKGVVRRVANDTAGTHTHLLLSEGSLHEFRLDYYELTAVTLLNVFLLELGEAFRKTNCHPSKEGLTLCDAITGRNVTRELFPLSLTRALADGTNIFGKFYVYTIPKEHELRDALFGLVVPDLRVGIRACRRC
jgi:hypothetical protein